MALQQRLNPVRSDGIRQQLHQRLGVAVADGQVLRRLKLLALPDGAAQNAVDQPRRTAVGVALGLLHCLIDGGGRRNLVQEQKLIQAQPQNVQHHRLQLLDGTGQQVLDVVIQHHPVLQHAVAQSAGQGRIPGVQPVPGNIFLQDPVGPGALLPAGNQRRQGCGSGVHRESPQLISMGWPRK